MSMMELNLTNKQRVNNIAGSYGIIIVILSATPTIDPVREKQENEKTFSNSL